MSLEVLVTILIAIPLLGFAVWMTARGRARRAGETGPTAITASGPETSATAATGPVAAPTAGHGAEGAPTVGHSPEGAIVAPPDDLLPDDLYPDDDLALIKEIFEENRQRAAALGVPSIFLEAYRDIRPWATSFAPGKPSPSILSDPEIIKGQPTTYRFRLKDRAYSILRTDLGDEDEGHRRLVHERLRLVDASGTTLFEMDLTTAGDGSDARPGEIATFVEGAWIEDLKELNALFVRDGKKISDDFRKKFRAKEAERLKRDIGV